MDNLHSVDGNKLFWIIAHLALADLDSSKWLIWLLLTMAYLALVITGKHTSKYVHTDYDKHVKSELLEDNNKIILNNRD